MAVEPPNNEMRDLLVSLVVGVPGADADLVKNKLETTLRAFTRESAAWRENVPFETVDGEQEYTLTSPCQGSYIGWVHQLNSETRVLSLPTKPYGYSAGLRADDAPRGAPRIYESPRPGVIRLTPCPDDTYPLYADVSLIATSIDSPLPPGWVVMFYDALHAGALHHLYMMPGMPWSSSKLAEFNGRKFRAGITDARISIGKTLAGGFQPTHFNPVPAGRLTR